ncbi:B3 DNA binding domain containing protein [Trema orientale]|uniref:B3 DNA binding domain containing protein n=1 Tax=Trema orientale TaxID=63057 RepID=A0A2P5FGV0_TREOI|nr:B3 DNA binding domain containing protein [Trema orientale]
MPPTRRNLQRRVGPSRGTLLRPTRISPPQFFKLMLRSTILDQKLLLPEEFSIEFGEELSTLATLTVPNGCTWRVGVKKSHKDNMIWFLDGWHIEYPSVDESSDEEDSDESDEIFDAKPFISNIGSSRNTRNCFSKRNIGRPSFGSPASGNSCEKNRSQRWRRLLCSKSSRHSKKRRFVKPHEEKKAEGHPSRNNEQAKQSYVPADFARKYLQSSSELITLEAPIGEQCIVSSNCYPRSHNSKRLDKGWCGFLRNNDLQEGDVCVFELISTKIIVLKVWIYRVADYAGR